MVQLARKIVTFLEPDSRRQAMLVYEHLQTQARDPWFYTQAKVPDTLDGRFEVLVLHVFLWLHRLKQEEDYDAVYAPAAEKLLEMMFDDMDQALREMGVGDMGVPKRIKAMAEALYGRIEAYEATLASKDDVHEALRRNVYGAGFKDAAAVNRLQLYLGNVADAYAERSAARLVEGTIPVIDPNELED